MQHRNHIGLKDVQANIQKFVKQFVDARQEKTTTPTGAAPQPFSGRTQAPGQITPSPGKPLKKPRGLRPPGRPRQQPAGRPTPTPAPPTTGMLQRLARRRPVTPEAAAPDEQGVIQVLNRLFEERARTQGGGR